GRSIPCSSMASPATLTSSSRVRTCGLSTTGWRRSRASSCFDRRGTGLSDRMREAPTLETRMDDLRAVLDAGGSEGAALFGTFEAATCSTWRKYAQERSSGHLIVGDLGRSRDFTCEGPRPRRASADCQGEIRRPARRATERRVCQIPSADPL